MKKKVGLIIVAAPSGAGKSSFVERICREDSRLVDTVTYTTRAMRAGESQGKPYHFVTAEDFQTKISAGFFVEYAQVHNNWYGTSLSQIEQILSQNKVVIMDVDVQGASTFKRKFPDLAVGIFILPPSIDELRRRIIKRDGRVPQDLEVRMANAIQEMGRVEEFDYRVINDKFEDSYLEFKKIVENLMS